MKFSEMRDKLLEHFTNMIADNTQLFEVAADKDKLWELYLNNFPSSKNPIFRERTEHDCSCCRHFIKALGAVVTIKNGKVISLWDFDITGDDIYEPSVKAMRQYIHSCAISDAFYTRERRIGTQCNRELADGRVFLFDHFYADVPTRFVTDNLSESRGQFRDTRNVFKRSLDELSAESVNIVLELIAQGSLYRGEEHKIVLQKFSAHKTNYDILDDAEKEIYVWEHSAEAGMAVGRIRNHSIGTLLVDISEGVDLDTAVRRYENMVAPANYKRPKAIFTKQMLEDAKKTISELGYMDSLKRRYATLDDITVNNILFANRDAASRIKGGDIFEEMAATIGVDPKRFNKVEEIGIDAFIQNVLPTAKEIELLFENRLAANMVSLIAPVNKDSKSMFKWDNSFCWAYTGNVTDSMKERVKAQGGSVTGDLRFSIQWNESGEDNSDLDAHCSLPSGNEIYFGRKLDIDTNGELDVDIVDPNCQVVGNNKTAVENITWADRKTMKDGIYKFYVHQYSGSLKHGFRAEIEFDGQIFSFDYPDPVRCNQSVAVAEVTLQDAVFAIKKLLPDKTSVREVWGLSTNQFVPVTVMMYSPNFWDGQSGIGNKHYFFMLKDCVNTESPNGFYNEFLNNELDKHKRVTEMLGTKLAVADADDQLSGVGFSSTKRNSVVVKIKAATERVLRIKF